MTTGTVSSNNLTSLYSNTTTFTAGVVNSSVYSVNGGLGVTVNPITGNVVVSIGQDVSTSSNVQFANVKATGNLSNNYYTLANALGTTGQVLTTNGAGTTSWTTPSTLGLVNSVSGSGAGITVSPITGAVIVSNTGVTSIVAGSNISISGATGAVTITATGFGTGDVTGPASATDNAIVRFDGTTGKLIQNSTVTIDDTTGNITTNGDIAVNGGDITTNVGSGGIANLYNSNAIGTINIGNSVVTEVNIGNISSGRVYIKSPLLETAGNAIIAGTISTEGVLVNLTTPVHQGQLLYVSDDATPTITNSSTVNFASTTYRPNFQQNTGVYGRTGSGAQVSNNTGAVNYTTGDGGSLLMGVQSNAQALNSIGSLSTAYNASGDHEIRLTTSTNGFINDQATSIITSNTLVFPTVHGFAVGDTLFYAGPTQNGLTINTTYYVIAAGFTTTQCQVSLTLGGSAVALTNGTGLSLYFFNGSQRLVSATSASVDILATTLLFNATNTGIPFTGLAGIEVERGTTGANQFLKWDETYDFWRATSNLYADDVAIGGVALATNGNNIYYNNENISPAGTCNLIVKAGVSAGVDANFRWNDTTKRWQDTIDGTNYFNLPNQNLDITDSPTFSNVSIDGQASLDTSTLTTTAITTVALNTSTRNAMSGLINIIQGANVHCLNYTALRVDATTAMLTTYGEMYNNIVLGNFTADVSAGALRLLVTPTSATSTVFSVVRTSLT